MQINWRHLAACRDLDGEIFFPVHETRREDFPSASELAAIEVCESCRVRAACLDWALTAGEVEFGVLGGLRACDRTALHRALLTVPASRLDEVAA